ncbi:hypothetical protein [Pantoea agglomerans]|uniref:hypothetical protein n=1 Tax=Enterobacter agglomerans TaxID=549 RepID=UPI0010C22C04|nr:hypothetical protein [Pantoea agglomerans]MBD8223229.1 hypothetical protein [Pantoea agglomerans]TKK30355.1 hypothetical protein PagCFBP13532_17850 [Pantoea agglomerans]
MSAIETLREMSEVWNLFGDMPDDATVGVDLAALYLGVSVKTLARYRQNGDGPPYVQYQSSDSKARNQRVNYLLGDLRAWRNSHRVKSTMQAAQVRGLTFTMLSDLTCPQPFWKAVSKGLIDHALRVTDEAFKIYLKNHNFELIWISVEQALLEDWINSEERNSWHSAYIDILNEVIMSSVALQQKHELLKVLR